MKVQIKYFGMSAEQSGCDAEEMTLDPSDTVDGLKKLLITRHPKLSGTQFQLAMNKTLVAGNEEITENSEIAVLPPFAGG